MDSKLALLLIAFISANVRICSSDNSTNRVFDVRSYGALAGGQTDNAEALLKAWNDACVSDCGEFGRATLMVPKGTFMAGPMSFHGPCKGAMTVEVNGVILAPTDLRVFRKEWIAFRRVNGLLITGGGKIDGQGKSAWPEKKGNRLPPSMKLLSVSNTRLQSLTFLNSKFFHILIGQSSGVALSNLTISAPGDSPNTDGIHVSNSAHIHISNSSISTGDDCISVGPGSSDVSISSVSCGPGHGISIGSLGKYAYDLSVSAVSVSNCTLTGTANGVRIKTWKDSPPINASGIVFSDIVMIDVRNPIVIDQEYCPDDGGCDDDKPPSRVKISNTTFERIRGTSATDVAVSLLCSESEPCDFTMEDVDLKPMPPSPGLLPAVPLSTCMHVGEAAALGFVFPPPCFSST